jgi:hypothetical protein
MKVKMLSSRTRVVFKFLFALSVWSFLLLGLFKLHGDSVQRHDHGKQAPINGRLLLQKDNKWSADQTSTTAERLVSAMSVDDVLVDNRVGEYLRGY